MVKTHGDVLQEIRHKNTLRCLFCTHANAQEQKVILTDTERSAISADQHI